MSATLKLTRPPRLADAARAYQVLLDGEAVGEVGNRRSIDLSIKAGRHTVQARTMKPTTGPFGLSSPAVTFEVDEGGTASFAVHAPRYPQAAISWVKVVLLGPKDRWIELERSEQVAGNP